MNSKKGCIIVFSPHPDDETLGCGGIIAKNILEGYEVIIVTMTDGRNALRSEGIKTDASLKEVVNRRKKGLERATRILGVKPQNMRFFDFKDGSLKKNEDEAVKKVAELLKEYTPEEIYFPYEKDANPDHRAANRIIRKAVVETGVHSKKLRYSILHKHSIVGPINDSFNCFFKNLRRQKIDISEYLGLKEKALMEYLIEIETLSKKKVPILTIKRVRKYLKEKESFYVDK